mgnify:CR=1 FL=1
MPLSNTELEYFDHNVLRLPGGKRKEYHAQVDNLVNDADLDSAVEGLVDGIWFNHTDSLPPRARMAFRLDADEWQGQKRLRFLIEAAAA